MTLKIPKPPIRQPDDEPIHIGASPLPVVVAMLSVWLAGIFVAWLLVKSGL